MKQTKIERLTKYYMGQESMTARKLKNRLATEEQSELAEKNQKPVKSIVINIEWKKSAMWGHNPHAEAQIEYADGTWERKDGYTAGGCGYDKESTVISQIFNDLLKYKLWQLEDTDVKDAPYGVRLDYDFNPSYGYGIGTSCYYTIAEFIDGELKNVASGKSFDTFRFTMNK